MSIGAYRILLFLLLIVIAAGAGARDWIVAPDGSGDAPTIIAARDSFSSGDRIVLLDGLYQGEGFRDIGNQEKMLVVVSQSNDPTACIIDCQGTADEQHFGFGFWGGG